MDNVIYFLILMSYLPIYCTIVLLGMFSFTFLPYIIFKQELYQQSVSRFFNSLFKSFFIPVSFLMNLICLILSPQAFVQKWLIHIEKTTVLTKSLCIGFFQNYMYYGMLWVFLMTWILLLKITKTK